MSVLRTVLASLVLLASGFVVLAAVTDGFHAFTTETARRTQIRERAPVVPSLPLQTASGEITSFDALRGRWLLVDFIYTRCTTYCSVQGSEFARLQRQLAASIAAHRIALLSISFDPEHDTPDALARYQQLHGAQDEGWIASRPVAEADLTQLMRVFGVVAVPDDLGGYVHNAAIAVVDPQGRLVAILDWNDTNGAVHYVKQRWMP